jgi:hypothetical protein
MTALDTQRARLGDDARFELVAAAGARERQNRPVWLVGAAAALLAVMIVVAALGVLSRNRAIGALRTNLSDQAQVERMAAEWRALNELESQPGNISIGAPRTDLRSTLENLAMAAGVKTARQLSPRESTESQGAITVRRLAYFNVREQSLSSLLEWLRRATQDPATRIHGLEVESLSLKPENNAWNMSLTLRRWERAS